MQIPEAVNQVNMVMMARSAVGIALTLYMMAILARWGGAWLQLDAASWWVRLSARTADPLILLMRRLLPPMGPVDWAPLAALIAVWFVRIVAAQY